MVIKIFYAFIALFSLAMVLILAQNPYISNFGKANIEIADMQMSGVKDYEISQNGINSYYEASIWQKFGEKNNFFNFYGTILDANSTHKISSQSGYQKENTLIFSGNAMYENDKNFTFLSQEIIYDMKNKILHSNVPFLATHFDNNLSGKRISYDIKNGIIRARSVNSVLKFEEN